MVDVTITKNQTEVIKEYKKGKCLFLYGSGTGKTFITLYHTERSLRSEDTIQRVYVVRSLMHQRDWF